MTIQEMKERKIELGLTNEMIAEASGVPLSTIQKIFGGATKAPRKLTLDAIARVLKRPEEDTSYRPPASGSHMVHDNAPIYGAAKETTTYDSAKGEPLYTIDDYYALPDDQRVELIDGKFYTMNAPSGIHQLILGELYVQFYKCMHDHDRKCIVFLSPFDVRLDRDNYTMVQPDLVVVCQEFDYKSSIRLEGAPDLAIEILSPSTRSKDMLLKLNKYYNAGVREYWIVDPKNQTVIVYSFEEEDFMPRTYSFDDKIPVAISKGFCVIDFALIKANVM